LLEIHGFGEFAANNMLQLLGKFDMIPTDSETARYLRERHSLNLNSKDAKKVSKKAQEIFGKYAP
jgi:endonuclease III